jgi:tRNA 2-thiouridine synthesizing protein A
MDADLEVDAIGLLCPLPVLRARKRLQMLATGQVLCLIADDPAAIIDVPHFCAEAGHEMLAQTVEGARQRFYIRKG